MKEIKRYFAYMGKHIYLYWIILTITLITESVLQVLYSYINKKVLNAVEYGDMKMFRAALTACVIVVVFKCFFPYLRYFQIKLVRTMVFEIKQKLFQKLMKLDMDFYEKNHSGEALKILNWDANSLKDSWFSHVYWVLGKITLGISSLAAMLLYSPVLTVISVIICAVTVIVSVKLNDKIKKGAKEVQKSTAKLAKYLSDILQGFPVLKMYKGSYIVFNHYQKENEKVTELEKRRVKETAKLEMLTFLLGILGSFGTIAAGIMLVSEGRLDYGTVMAVVTLQMGVGNTMQRLGSSLATFSTSLVKAGRVFDFLELTCEEEPEEKGEKEPVQADFREAPVQICNLTFSYDDVKVLDSINMDIKPDEKVIIRGESGRGKSTLLKLLAGFYPVKAGQIQVYGRDINTFSKEQLRNMITYIPQESYLFETTIAENIGYGSNDTGSKTREEIIRAAKHACADEFISEMPDGYDTVIRAGGSNLSGGQRQRIAIARAFLKDAPILLMDEPSSSLDIESEQKINEAVGRLMKDRVVLMVTHKETGIDGFDRAVNL